MTTMDDPLSQLAEVDGDCSLPPLGAPIARGKRRRITDADALNVAMMAALFHIRDAMPALARLWPYDRDLLTNRPQWAKSKRMSMNSVARILAHFGVPRTFYAMLVERWRRAIDRNQLDPLSVFEDVRANGGAAACFLEIDGSTLAPLDQMRGATLTLWAPEELQEQP